MHGLGQIHSRPGAHGNRFGGGWIGRKGPQEAPCWADAKQRRRHSASGAGVLVRCPGASTLAVLLLLAPPARSSEAEPAEAQRDASVEPGASPEDPGLPPDLPVLPPDVLPEPVPPTPEDTPPPSDDPVAEPASPVPRFYCPPGWHCEPQSPAEPEPATAPAPEVAPEAPPRIALKPQAEPVPPPLEPKPLRLSVAGRVSWGPLRVAHRSGVYGAGATFGFPADQPFQFEVALDAFVGRDALVQRRADAVFSPSLLLVPHPNKRWSPLLSLGPHLAVAKVDSKRFSEQTFWYLGWFVGPGVQRRLGPMNKTVLAADVVMFFRWRIDARADTHPEFTDFDTARTTNASSGALLRCTLKFAL